MKGKWGLKPLLLITLAIVRFGFLMSRLGLVPALVAVFIVSAAAGREFRWKEVLVLILVTACGADCALSPPAPPAAAQSTLPKHCARTESA